jgi:hypothetical protein
LGCPVPLHEPRYNNLLKLVAAYTIVFNWQQCREGVCIYTRIYLTALQETHVFSNGGMNPKQCIENDVEAITV